MAIHPVNNLQFDTAPVAERRGIGGAARPAGREFAATMALGRRTQADDPEAAKTAAAQLLSTLFFTPLLAEMRSFPLGKEYGHGGMMEDAFAEQLDQRIADQVAREADGLVDVVARRFEPRPTHFSPTEGATASTHWLRAQLDVRQAQAARRAQP